MDDKLSCLGSTEKHSGPAISKCLGFPGSCYCCLCFCISIWSDEVQTLKVVHIFILSQVDHVYLSSSMNYLNVQNLKSIIWQHWIFFLFFLWKTLFCHFLLRCHLNYVGKSFMCWYILNWQFCLACDLQFFYVCQDMNLIMYLIGPFRNTSRHNKQRCWLNHPWVFSSPFVFISDLK